ncbi:hypothetical protein GGX14DRAFT_484326 [Mycena pura]|uniref:Zn(2)-C6 fungal-type domain-containing protein n=1 Tax=Mycena pura TaxID=153505 RepID=A0AAD6UT77_9AGAR|nr:hypothetical protein GGX14DRAFT_484326 [Mycena pura]
MFSLDDPHHPYLQRSSIPDDVQPLYRQHATPRTHYSSADDASAPFGQRRFASNSPPARFQDHVEYSAPQGLPAMSAGRLSEMSRIDTSAPFTRRDESQPSGVQPVSATSVDLSGDSEAWSPTQPARPRKPRREKTRIELAPDQPPTTQGKPRTRVYVACLQCRTRKIRCDGAKPACHNCSKRTTSSNDCNYDSLPKRRGPDKNPGARQRIPRKNSEGPRRPRRRATSSSDNHNYPAQNSFPSPASSEDTPEEYMVSPHEPHINVSFGKPCVCHGLTYCPSSLGSIGLDKAPPSPQITIPYDSSLNLLLASPLEAPSVSRAFITEYNNENDSEYRQKDITTIASQPSIDFSRKIWWDSLLSLYLSPSSTRLDNVSVSQRNLAGQQISTDLRFLFRTSSYWFSFLHAPTFFSNFYDPARRERMQPSLVLAALAMSTFWQSSEIGWGHQGRVRAIRFRDEAQSALEASYNAGWVDDTLAQAAWMLAIFEVCAHPNHSRERSSSAMIMLDSIIRSLSLTMVDANDPNTTIFVPGKVPVVASTHQAVHPMRNGQCDYPYSTALPVSTDCGCSCLSLTLKEQWPQTMDHTPLWAQTPAWSASWSEAEIKKESCRRLCWSSMILAAGHSNYSYVNRLRSVDLFIADPANYALLFSGEAVVHSPSAKDTIWALHDRSFLLWHACIKMRNDVSAPVAAKGQFAIKAWLEADAIEDALNRHTCGIERAFIFQGREYIFNTRMCITYEFQRFVPLVSNNVSGLFQRQKAEEWLSHQAAVAQKFTTALHAVTGNSSSYLSRRPFYVFWLMAQVSRGLTLWHYDKTLTIALDVCKNLLAPIDYLSALWPCAGNKFRVLRLTQRERYQALRERLREACDIAQVSTPPPLNLSLPPPSIDEIV